MLIVFPLGLLAMAAPFGFIDWLAIPSATRAKRVGALHGGGNLLVVVLFAMSWIVDKGAHADAPSSLSPRHARARA